MVHAESTTVEVRAIEVVDGVLRADLVAELAESEALRAARLTVVHEATSKTSVTKNRRQAYRTLVTLPAWLKKLPMSSSVVWYGMLPTANNGITRIRFDLNDKTVETFWETLFPPLSEQRKFAEPERQKTLHNDKTRPRIPK